MIVLTNIPQNPIWIREKEGAMRRITLRKNFVSEIVEGETRISFDEVDILLEDSPDLADYVILNFNACWDSAIGQAIEDEETV